MRSTCGQETKVDEYGNRRRMFQRWSMLPLATFLALIFSCLAPIADAQNGVVKEAGFRFQRLLSNLKKATDFRFLPDDRMLLLDRLGHLFLYDKNFNRIDTILDLSDVTCPNCSERGMLSVTIHPKFEENGYIYLYWVHTNLEKGTCECEIQEVQDNINAPTTRMSRFKVVNDKIDRKTEKIIFETSPVGRMHNGGAADFGLDGYLYVAIGDGQYRTNADSPSNQPNCLLGKLLRLTDEGEPAPSNPYMNDPNGQKCNTRRLVTDGKDSNKKCQEIYHLGLRNPFSMSLDPNLSSPSYSRMIIGDVGSGSWEEITVAECGLGYPQKHFGWPFREGPCLREQTRSSQCYLDDKYEEPIHFYGRPGPEGQGQAAITAVCIVPNGVWPEKYDGAHFYADLRRGRIYNMIYDSTNECRGTACTQQRSKYKVEAIVQDENLNRNHPLASPVRLRMGPGDGAMYMLSHDGGGVFYKLWNTQDTNRSPTAVISDLFYSLEEGGYVTVSFDGSKSSDPDGHKITYEWDFGYAGQTATGKIVSYTYENFGNYTATLTVKDERGRKSSHSVVVYVNGEGTQLENFVWGTDDCPAEYDACGVLEFCKEGGRTYGYRTPKPSCNNYGTCVPGRSPVIRLDRGKKYQFTLRNAALDGTTPTNIHTHGLHISGSGDADNILRNVTGGHCLDYTWDIPDDHPSGTYWYHSHYHGTSLEQVGGGAFGMLIVNDRRSEGTPSWAFNELLLQVASDTTLGRVLANGLPYEIFPIKANQWYRLRLSIVDPLAIPRDVEFTDGCTVHKVASDGVWHSSVPGPEGDLYQMTGASRADFAVMCPTAHSTINIRWNGVVVAIIDVGLREDYQTLNMTNWKPARPESLRGIASADIAPENKYSLSIERSSLNNKHWDPLVPLSSLAFNAVHEWELSDSRGHPFHMHLYHMMVVTPGGCGAHKEGEFYDTISGPECKVRFKTADIGEMMVIHCHVIGHSDSGSMGWMNVTGSGMPINRLASDEYTCSDGRETLSCPPTPAPTLPPIIPDITYLFLEQGDRINGGEQISSTPTGFSLNLSTDGKAQITLGDAVVYDFSHNDYEEGTWYMKVQGDCNLVIKKQEGPYWLTFWKSKTSGSNCFLGIFLDENNVQQIGVMAGSVSEQGPVMWSQPLLAIDIPDPPSTFPTSLSSFAPSTPVTAPTDVGPVENRGPFRPQKDSSAKIFDFSSSNAWDDPPRSRRKLHRTRLDEF